MNASEGKEERYVFFKNLYNIINDSSQLNKPVFQIKKLQMKYFKKSNPFQLINKQNIPLPTLKSKLMKEMNDKSKNCNYNIKDNYYTNNTQLMPILIKSSSGTNINPKYKSLPYFAS